MDAQQPSPSLRDRQPPLSTLAQVITPSQVIALGLVVASIGWAAWLLRDRPANEEVELLAGTALPSSEMAIMEAAFDRAQLTDHRTDGGRVWVPRSRQSAYMRALVDAEALPREFGGSLRRALEKNSPWQSRAVQGEMLRAATQEELSLVICSMPGIERAAVLYDTESHHSLEGGGPAKTASVNVRTQPDMELDTARIQAIRVLVSASIAGLTPERVAVTDLRSGRVHAGPLEAEADRAATALAAADPALARQAAHEHHLATKVRQSLAFLKGATVDVSVDFGRAEAVAFPVAPRPEDLQSQPATEPATNPAAEPATGSMTAAQKPADANAPAEIRPRSVIIVASEPPATPPPAVAAPPVRPIATDVPESILVSIAVPDSYFQIACRAAMERAGQPTLEPMAIEAHETERIRRHVLSLLPATRDPSQRRVLITSFPVASTSLARREQTGRGMATAAARGGPIARSPQASSGSASQASSPSSSQVIGFDDTVAALAAGRFSDVPRQAWLAATSVCVGLLAGFLWWMGSRPDRSRADRFGTGRPMPSGMQQPRIDWSGGGDADNTVSPSGRGPDSPDTGYPTAREGLGRAAMLLFALCAAATPARGAGPTPLPDVATARGTATASEMAPLPAIAVAPLPESILPESHFKGEGLQPASLEVPVGPMAIDLAAPPLSAAGSSGSLANWQLLAAIGAAFAVVAAATVLTKRRTTLLPPDVFEVLGEGSLGGQHAVRIVRFGPKTLLVGVSAAGCQTLAELSDPQATACIAAACRGVYPAMRPAASPRSRGSQLPTGSQLSAGAQPPTAPHSQRGGEAA
jgi:type III secretory pathway lipoprotein EscJ